MIPAISHPQNDKITETGIKLAVPRSEGWFMKSTGEGKKWVWLQRGINKGDVSGNGVIPYLDHDDSYRNQQVKKITWNSIHMLYQCQFPSF